MISARDDKIPSDKISEILLAAQKRFGTYGFEKTAMHEIASDLGMSKASLYYYFPDKESLYKAVVEKETQEYFNSLEEELKNLENPEKAFIHYAKIRMGYFRTLQNLSRVRFEENKGIRNIIHELRLRFREKERAEIVRLLDLGIEKEIFEIDNREAVANLFLDSLRGISIVFMKNQESAHLKESDYGDLENQVGLFIKIFIKGISNA
jgi:AcrR family transcriptional regulator